MPIPADEQLYEQAKSIIVSKYKKNSAYRSGAIIQAYKKLFHEQHPNEPPYLDDRQPRNLKRWFQEEWTNVVPLVDSNENDLYPVLRPLRRISKKTPLTITEIPIQDIKKQVQLKQKYKGNKNLPPFVLRKNIETK